MAITKGTTKDEKYTHVKCLLYGKSGVGKTTSLLTLPHNRLIVLGVERGLLPLRNETIEAWKLDTWKDIRDAYAELVKLDGTKDIIVVDSLTEVAELCKAHVVNVDRPSMYARANKELVGVYDELMGMQEWGLYDRHLRNLISAYVKLPKHVIFTALDSWRDSEDGRLIRTPALQGKLGQQCAAFFDVVLYMRAEDTETETRRVWQTYGDSETIAKDASGALD